MCNSVLLQSMWVVLYSEITGLFRSKYRYIHCKSVWVRWNITFDRCLQKSLPAISVTSVDIHWWSCWRRWSSLLNTVMNVQNTRTYKKKLSIHIGCENNCNKNFALSLKPLMVYRKSTISISESVDHSLKNSDWRPGS